MFYGCLVQNFLEEIVNGGDTNQGNFAQSARVQEVINAAAQSHREHWINLPFVNRGLTERKDSVNRFDEKVAVITGSGDGIGLQIAQSFAAEGATVVIAEINETSGKACCRKDIAAGGRAFFVQVDVSDETQVEKMVKKVVEQLGRIDILVNNAGVVVHVKVVDMPREAWDRQLGVQLTGPFLVSKHVARHMIARGGGGKIVNISSVSAVMGRHKAAAHCSAKGGLTMLTKVLAMEMGEYNVNVNAVAPGLIDVPSQRAEENIFFRLQTQLPQ